jgi:hypothetical protein
LLRAAWGVSGPAYVNNVIKHDAASRIPLSFARAEAYIEDGLSPGDNRRKGKTYVETDEEISGQEDEFWSLWFQGVGFDDIWLRVKEFYHPTL